MPLEVSDTDREPSTAPGSIEANLPSSQDEKSNGLGTNAEGTPMESPQNEEVRDDDRPVEDVRARVSTPVVGQFGCYLRRKSLPSQGQCLLDAVDHNCGYYAVLDVPLLP